MKAGVVPQHILNGECQVAEAQMRVDDDQEIIENIDPFFGEKNA